jgi:hypothetical protein
MPEDCRYTRYAATFPLQFFREVICIQLLAPVDQVQKKSLILPATARYKPLHFHFRIPYRHILNSFVENIGVIPFYDALRLISDALNVRF